MASMCRKICRFFYVHSAPIVVVSLHIFCICPILYVTDSGEWQQNISGQCVSGIGLLLLTFIFYGKTIIEGPGFVKKKTEAGSVKSLGEKALGGEEDDRKRDRATTSVKDEDVSGAKIRRRFLTDDSKNYIPEEIKVKESLHSTSSSRFCPICSIPQPLRSKHCTICKHCIHTYDHHCTWLGICIGEKNRRWFLLYLIFQSMLLLQVLFLNKTVADRADVFGDVSTVFGFGFSMKSKIDIFDEKTIRIDPVTGEMSYKDQNKEGEKDEKGQDGHHRDEFLKSGGEEEDPLITRARNRGRYPLPGFADLTPRSYIFLCTVLLLGFVLELTFFAMTSSLFAFQLFYISMNLTSWESNRWSRISYLKNLDPRKGSPFSQGLVENWKMVCCPKRGQAKREQVIDWKLGKQHIPPLVFYSTFDQGECRCLDDWCDKRCYPVWDKCVGMVLCCGYCDGEEKCELGDYEVWIEKEEGGEIVDVGVKKECEMRVVR